MNSQRQKTYLRNTIYFPRFVLALSLLFVGGVIAYTLYQEYELIENRERERLSTQSNVIGENLARQLDGVYLALEGIRKEMPQWSGKKGQEQRNLHLGALADAMPGIRTFMIANAKGQIIACNREQIIGQNISYREYFQAPSKGRNRSIMYISPPFKSLLGNFVINVTLMVPGPQGEFAGVVSAALDPEYFSILLGSVLYAPDMWVGLAHGDGKQFLMVPDRQGMAGLDLARPETFFTRHLASGQTANVFTGRVYATGDTRMMALRTIRPGNVHMDKPLVIAVGRNLSALYADWRRGAFGKAILFSVMALPLTAALLCYQKRQQRFEVVSARYLEELQHANETKSRLLSTVAHEFRTPLSLLTSSTDILDRYDERLSPEEHTRQHDHIRSAARQMSSLVDSVLAFNNPESRLIPLEAIEVDIAQFCRNLVEEIKAACCTGHEFSVVIASDCGTALLDKVLFRRIVENLLTNAFRYTPATGTVALHVSRDGNRLRIVIRDSGIGIPEECRKQIFDAFYRCWNVETQRGLGLGLSIVAEALSTLGGDIIVDSAVGKGTTMDVTIPVVETSETQEQPPCTQS